MAHISSIRLWLTAAATSALIASCATVQENPNYQYSTKYKGASPYGATQMAGNTTTVTTQAVTYQQPTQNAGYVTTTTAVAAANPAVQAAGYQTATTAQGTGTYTQLDHRCLTRETNRELIGGAVGGTAGAVLGKKVIGGTKGTVAGAALGGALGYGIGDKSINCDPVPVAISQQSATISPAYYPDNGAADTGVIYASNQTSGETSPAPIAPTETAMPSAVVNGYGTPGYQAMMGEETVYGYSADKAAVVVPNPQPVTAPEVYSAASSQTTMNTPYGTQDYNMGNTHTVSQGDTVYSLSRQLCTSIEDIRTMNGLDAQFGIKIGDQLRLPASRC